MPVKVKACWNVKTCLKGFGECFCCDKGHEGDGRCLTEGNPLCPDYTEGVAFDAEEVERMQRHIFFN